MKINLKKRNGSTRLCLADTRWKPPNVCQWVNGWANGTLLMRWRVTWQWETDKERGKEGLHGHTGPRHKLGRVPVPASQARSTWCAEPWAQHKEESTHSPEHPLRFCIQTPTILQDFQGSNCFQILKPSQKQAHGYSEENKDPAPNKVRFTASRVQQETAKHLKQQEDATRSEVINNQSERTQSCPGWALHWSEHCPVD